MIKCSACSKEIYDKIICPYCGQHHSTIPADRLLSDIEMTKLAEPFRDDLNTYEAVMIYKDIVKKAQQVKLKG